MKKIVSLFMLIGGFIRIAQNTLSHSATEISSKLQGEKNPKYDFRNDCFFPVQSVYILNYQREIEFEYISFDFIQRISKDLLLVVAETFKK